MNHILSRISFLTVLGSAWVLAFGAITKSDSASQTESPPKLPHGVAEVLKLSQAKVGEDIISSYIQNSGAVFNLSPSDILYLKEQGVSERIVSQMLDQRKRRAEANAQPSAAMAQSQPASTYAAASAPAPAPAPTYFPSSLVYVTAQPATTYPYYGYSPYYYGPYYGGYYGYPYYPFFGFGFGGYGRYGYYGGYRGYYGGYHGGYGGYHGGYGGSHGGFGGSHGGGHR